MCSQKETEGAWTRYILINSTMVIISQPLHASKYHAVHFKIHKLIFCESHFNKARERKQYPENPEKDGFTRKSKDTECYRLSAKICAQLRFADRKKKKITKG